MSLILRNVKGSALTYNEGDANLLYLESLFTGATSGLTLENTLIAGNTTGGNNIIMSAGDTIDSASGTAQLDLRYGGTDNEVMLSTDAGGFTEGYMYMLPGFIELWADNGLSPPDTVISTISLFTTGDGGINLDAHTTTTKNLKIDTNFGLQFGTGPKRVMFSTAEITWNMDANAASPLISHGLSATEWLTIVDINAQVKVGTSYIRSLSGDKNYVNINAADIQASRETGGTFDSATYNAAKLVVTFWYTPD